MEVKCSSCHKTINIPDQKIPQGKSFSVRCPSCRGKISVDLSPPPEQAQPQAAAEGWAEQQQKEADAFAVSGEDYDASEKPFDFLEEEGLTAMLLEQDAEKAAHIKEVLEVMDYHVTMPENIREALRKMKYHQFDLIVLNETFDSSSPEANGVLIYLQRLNMHVRRNMFVALLTERYDTKDNMAAFLKSVNLVINVKDIRNIDRILTRGINDNDLFYNVFKESLKKLGRV